MSNRYHIDIEPYLGQHDLIGAITVIFKTNEARDKFLSLWNLEHGNTFYGANVYTVTIYPNILYDDEILYIVQELAEKATGGFIPPVFQDFIDSMGDSGDE